MSARSRIRTSLILLLVAGVAVVLTLPPSAFATYPGANGKIAFLAPHGYFQDIFSLNLDRTGLKDLTDNGANNTIFRWSPDGTKIAFVSDGDGADNYYDVYKVNADGGGLTKLSNTGDAGTFDWSPDSSKLVFNDGTSIWTLWTVTADGSGLTQITDGEHHYQDPAWSPDGTRIAVEKLLAWPNSEIYTMNPDGTDETRLTDTPYQEQDPVWSPDGEKLAFVTNRETGCQPPSDGCYTIYVMNADGSAQTRLTNDTATDLAPQWSPDGSKIAFLSLRDGPTAYHIYTINADGTNERKLTGDSANESLHVWSPDSSQIAFVRQTTSGAKVYVINADGSRERFLADGYWPDWQRLVRSEFKNAAEFCKAQREASGRVVFKQQHGSFANCVRQHRTS